MNSNLRFRKNQLGEKRQLSHDENGEAYAAETLPLRAENTANDAANIYASDKRHWKCESMRMILITKSQCFRENTRIAPKAITEEMHGQGV